MIAVKLPLLIQAASFGLGAGVTTSLSVPLAAAVVDESTRVPIGVAVGVGFAACSVVFWIGQRIQKLTDEIQESNRVTTALSLQLKAVSEHTEEAKSMAAAAVLTLAKQAKDILDADARMAAAVLAHEAKCKSESLKSNECPVLPSKDSKK